MNQSALRVTIGLLAVSTAACATRGAVRPEVAPIDPTRGALAVYLAVTRPGAQPLALALEELAAIRSDGEAIPLGLSTEELAPAVRESRLLVAERVLEPAVFLGLRLRFRRATLGTADLLLPRDPVVVDVPFALRGGAAVVLWLELDQAASVADGFAFAPRLSGELAPRTVSSLRGLCVLPGAHRLIGFDALSHRVTAIVPTGHGPSGIAVDPVRELGFVALSADDEVQVFDLATDRELARIRLSPGDEPAELLLTPDRARLLVVARGGAALIIVDAHRLLETGRVRLEARPEALVLDRSGSRAFVSDPAANTISVVDLATLTAFALRTEDRPLRPQLDRSGAYLYVAHAGTPSLRVLSTTDFTERRRLHVGLGTTAIRVDPVTDLLYVANAVTGTLSVFDRVAPDAVGTVELGGSATELVVDRTRGVLYAVLADRHLLRALDLATRRAAGDVDLGGEPGLLYVPGAQQ